MVSPALAFSALLAGIYASLSHFLWGRTMVGLLIYVLAALSGFALGHFALNALEFRPLVIGQVNVIGGTVGCWLFLFVAHWVER